MKYFTEIQRNPPWIYVLVGSSLFTILVIIGSQFFKTDAPAEKEELLIALVIVLVAEAISVLFLITIKQEVTIDKNGIYYRYPPFKNKEVYIPISKIKNYDSISYQSMQYGYKVGFFATFVKTPSITAIGISKVIKLNFTDNTSFLIGTKKPEEFISTLNTIKSKYDETI